MTVSERHNPRARSSTSTIPDPPSVADMNACVHCGLCLPHCPTFRETARRDRVAARPAPPDAGARRGARRGDGHVRLAHVALPGLPRLRGRLPDRRQVRAPDGGDARRGPGASPAHRVRAGCWRRSSSSSCSRTPSGWRCSRACCGRTSGSASRRLVRATGLLRRLPGRLDEAEALLPRISVALLRAARHRSGARRAPEAGRLLRRLHHARRLRRDEPRDRPGPGAGRLRRRPARGPDLLRRAPRPRRRARDGEAIWPARTSRRSSSPTPSGSS